MSVNKIYLFGNLGADPELRYTPTGAPVATFTLATNERFMDRAGQLQEHTEWHRIVAWGKMAERCNEMLRKGSQVYVDGKITSSKWQDRDGVDRTTTEIKVDQMRLFWSPGPVDTQTARPRRENSVPWPEPASGSVLDEMDDIPF